MTCLNALFAALKRPWLLAFPASDHKSRPTSVDACPTAQTMRQMHLPAESVSLERRALMLHNRSRKDAAKYMRIHAILSRGR
jgi:hypothetical protein